MSRASRFGPAKEALTARRAVTPPLRTVAADDVKQLLAHLVAALAELHRHYGHDVTEWIYLEESGDLGKPEQYVAAFKPAIEVPP